MIVKIDKLSHDFRGITKVNDKVTFVEGALPTETVDIRIIKEKKNYNDAKIISYIEESSDRVNYQCPFYDKCGACDIGYIDYNKGIEYKKNNYIDIMKRYANIDINPDKNASSTNAPSITFTPTGTAYSTGFKTGVKIRITCSYSSGLIL